MSLTQRTHRQRRPQAIAVRWRTAALPGAVVACLPAPLATDSTVEIFLLLLDEMDDWLGACRQFLRRQLP